jgi:nucleoside-diphosphate-sugar epimerase
MKTAVIGTMNALSCARDAGARMLLASTSEIYGDPQVHPQVEGYLGNVNTLGPRSSYDEGKRAGEALVHSWTQQYKTDVRIARIFNTYGPRMASGDGRLIPNFVNQAIQNKPLTIYGTGEQTRSLCYVDDTVAGLMALMEVESTRLLVDTGSGRISVPVNIGNPDERTVLSIAQAIISNFSGCPGVVHGSALEDDPMRRCPDITRAKEVLGWEPVVNLEAGLLATIRWFQSRVSQ